MTSVETGSIGSILNASHNRSKLSPRDGESETPPQNSDQSQSKSNADESPTKSINQLPIVQEEFNDVRLAAASAIQADYIKGGIDQGDSLKIKDNQFPSIVTRDDVDVWSKLLDARNYNLFTIKLEKYGDFAPLPPYTSTMLKYTDNKLCTPDKCPIVNFSYDMWQVDMDTLNFTNNLSLELPSGYRDRKTLTLEFRNDSHDTINNYLSVYRKIMVPSYNLVRPYKDCVTKCSIYCYDKFTGLEERNLYLKNGDEKSSELGDGGFYIGDDGQYVADVNSPFLQKNERSGGNYASDKPTNFVYRILIIPDLGSKTVSNQDQGTVQTNWKIVGVIL